jgi:hypothetical protein
VPNNEYVLMLTQSWMMKTASFSNMVNSQSVVLIVLKDSVDMLYLKMINIFFNKDLTCLSKIGLLQ